MKQGFSDRIELRLGTPAVKRVKRFAKASIFRKDAPFIRAFFDECLPAFAKKYARRKAA